MTEAFNERLRTASVTPSADDLSAWETAIDQWHPEIDAAQALALAGFALGDAPTDTLVSAILERLPSEAPGRVEPTDLHLLRLLATEVLIALLSDPGDLPTRTALAVRCGSFLNGSAAHTDLLTAAEQRLRQASAEAYDLPNISGLSAAPAGYKTAVAALTTGAEISVHHAALVEMTTELNRLRNAVVRMRNGIVTSQRVLRARGDMLWLTTSPTSPSIGSPLTDLDPGARPAIAALDLFVAAPTVPGPTIATRVLAHLLGDDASYLEKQFTISESVEKLGEYRTLFPTPSEQLRRFLPLLTAVASDTGAEISYPAVSIAEETYRELLLNNDE